MLRRRSKSIIVCDPPADSKFGFGDLANAVRKVRIDLGIPIEPLVTKYVGPQNDEGFGKYCAFYGITLWFYRPGHPPPHSHARYGEHEARIELGSLRLISGPLPRRALNLVRV